MVWPRLWPRSRSHRDRGLRCGGVVVLPESWERAMPKAARPVAVRGNKGRIRWIDAEGQRQSDVYKAYNKAERQRESCQVEADGVRRGRPRAGSRPRKK